MSLTFVSSHWHYHFQFVLNQPSSSLKLLQFGWVPKTERLQITGIGLYRLRVLPVTQPAVSKHWRKLNSLAPTFTAEFLILSQRTSATTLTTHYSHPFFNRSQSSISVGSLTLVIQSAHNDSDLPERRHRRVERSDWEHSRIGWMPRVTSVQASHTHTVKVRTQAHRLNASCNVCTRQSHTVKVRTLAHRLNASCNVQSQLSSDAASNQRFFVVLCSLINTCWSTSAKCWKCRMCREA